MRRSRTWCPAGRSSRVDDFLAYLLLRPYSLFRACRAELLSLMLAREIGGDAGVRVNTLFPGPIESERIDTVFANMDALQDQKPGHTSAEFRNLMTNTRATRRVRSTSATRSRST